jgi:hypothetical protein
MTRIFQCLALALSGAAPLLSQDTVATGPCRAFKPRPACSVILLTNAGAYVGSRSVRALVDWGVMFKVGGRGEAIGASLFALGDMDGVAAGPAVRYRRWRGPEASLDAAVGTSIVVSQASRNPQIMTGSLYGLVKWNPKPWFGVSARPELIREMVLTSCGTFGCTFDTRSVAQLSIGVEFSGVPGFVLSLPGVLALALADYLARAD